MAFNIHQHMREHGQNIEAIKNLKADSIRHEKSITGLQGDIDKAKGGWRALLLVGTIAGTLGAIVTRVFFH